MTAESIDDIGINSSSNNITEFLRSKGQREQGQGVERGRGRLQGQTQEQGQEQGQEQEPEAGQGDEVTDKDAAAVKDQLRRTEEQLGLRSGAQDSTWESLYYEASTMASLNAFSAVSELVVCGGFFFPV